MLIQWPALQSYCASHEGVEKRGRVKECHAKLENLEMKCYYYFLSFALKPLADFNVAFQAEGLMLHNLHGAMGRVIKKFMGYFIPVISIIYQDLKHVKFKGKQNQLSDEELNIGSETRAFII